MHTTRLRLVLPALAAALLAVPMRAQGPPAAPPMVDLAGSWAMANDEELLIRVDPGPELENYTGFPLNAAGRQKALTWNSTPWGTPAELKRRAKTPR